MYKSLSQGLHNDCHVALSDSLTWIRPRQKEKGRGEGGEGDPDKEATSVLVWCGPDVDSQMHRNWVRDRGMEKKERFCEPTAAGWNF